MIGVPSRPGGRGNGPGRDRVLLLAFLLHNAEEAVTSPRYLPALHAELARFAPGRAQRVAQVTPATARSRGPLLLALAMGVNVLLSHVPAAILRCGYAPGLVTALVLNLPAAWVVCHAGGDRPRPTCSPPRRGPGRTSVTGRRRA